MSRECVAIEEMILFHSPYSPPAPQPRQIERWAQRSARSTACLGKLKFNRPRGGDSSFMLLSI